jgi:hypothetical protein
LFLGAALLSLDQGLRSALLFGDALQKFLHASQDAAKAMATTNPIQHSFELAAERCA